MKKIQKLKLSHLSKEEMEKRELNALRGGACRAGCGCEYAGEQGENCGSSGDSYYGGSSTYDNKEANLANWWDG
jgi:natural product precursor